MLRLRPHAGRARGVSLVELMVALVLGLIVTGSALTLVMTHRQTFSATQDMGRVQEGVRLAFEMMNRELRAAGGNPCDSTLNVYSGLKDPGANWWSNWADLSGAAPGAVTTTAPALRGYGGGTAFPDDAFGTAKGKRVNGTDAIEVKASVPLSADVAVVTTDLPQLPTDDIVVNTTSGVVVGDLLLICNYVNASIFRVTDIAGGNLKHGTGAGAWDNTDSTLAQAVTGDPADNFNLGAVVAKVHAARWYIGNNGVDTDADGVADGRSLYRAMLVNNAGTLGVATDEIAQGVTDMQISYLARGATGYVDAAAVTSWSDGAKPIVGARIELTLAGDARIGPNGERVQRTMVHTVAIRGRAE